MWWLVGGVVLAFYMFLYALCKVASDADDSTERVMARLAYGKPYRAFVWIGSARGLSCEGSGNEEYDFKLGRSDSSRVMGARYLFADGTGLEGKEEERGK